MAKRPADDLDDTDRWDALILSLIREKGHKEIAAQKAGVPRSTLYFWFRNPRFRARYREARREAFDEALAILEMGAAKVAKELLDQAENAQDETVRVAAAKAFLANAFKVSDSLLVQDELNELRAVITQLQHGQSKNAAASNQEEPRVQAMSAEDQAEACRLRVEWMTELGHSGDDVQTSLRYNRPQSVVEERHQLELVRKLMEAEKLCQP